VGAAAVVRSVSQDVCMHACVCASVCVYANPQASEPLSCTVGGTRDPPPVSNAPIDRWMDGWMDGCVGGHSHTGGMRWACG
jgi:hypothetical protein